MRPGDNYFRREIVKIADHALHEDIIQSLTFEDCEIVGPAILAPLRDVEFANPRFSNSMEAVLWEVVPPREVVGLIGLVDIKFISCSFRRVGIAVQPEAYRALLTDGAWSSPT